MTVTVTTGYKVISSFPRRTLEQLRSAVLVLDLETNFDPIGNSCRFSKSFTFSDLYTD